MSGLPFQFLFDNITLLDSFDPKVKEGIIWATAGLIIATYNLTLQLFAPWVERKVMARMQHRRGPVYVGKYGVLQNIADTIKLLFKQDTIPARADEWGFNMSIFLIVVTAVAAFGPIPLTSTIVGSNMNIGLLYIFALFSLFPPAMLLGGWASNSKYSLLGGFRAAAQLVAYEIPLMLSILGVLIYTQTFNLQEIARYQFENGWLIFHAFPFMLILAYIFYTASIAETERTPFDIPEAEGELVMGSKTEFSGWRYAFLLMVEYLHLWINSIVVIMLFLGGWDPLPPLKFPPFINIEYNATINALRENEIMQFLALQGKILLFVFIAAWVRSALPRFRIDQFISFGWKTLIPATLLAVAGVTFYAGLWSM